MKSSPSSEDFTASAFPRGDPGPAKAEASERKAAGGGSETISKNHPGDDLMDFVNEHSMVLEKL